MNVMQLKQAYQALHTQNWPEAYAQFKAILLQEPHCIEALSGLGFAAMMQENYEEASGIWERVVINAENVQQSCSAYSALGSIAYQRKQFSLAIQYLLSVLKVTPQDSEAVRQIAWSYIELNQNEQALMWCETLIKLAPQDVMAYYNQGVVLMRMLRWQEAQHAFQRVLQLEPWHIDATINLAAVMLKQQKSQESIAYYKAALELQPQHPIASYMLAALTGQAQWRAAPSDFVSQLYDRYAATYEQSVLHQLNYQVPDLFVRAIVQHKNVKEAAWQILDLGCGTGLAGQVICGFARTLIGVDVSSVMLDLAADKKIYTELHHMPMENYLAQCNKKFELIYAADSLIYIGDLLPLFQHVKSVLTDKGLFIFSVEKKLEKNEEKFVLQKTGRFTHDVNYLKNITQECGFLWLSCEAVTLRMQEDHPVEGYIVVLSQ